MRAFLTPSLVLLASCGPIVDLPDDGGTTGGGSTGAQRGSSTTGGGSGGTTGGARPLPQLLPGYYATLQNHVKTSAADKCVPFKDAADTALIGGSGANLTLAMLSAQVPLALPLIQDPNGVYVRVQVAGGGAYRFTLRIAPDGEGGFAGTETSVLNGLTCVDTITGSRM